MASRLTTDGHPVSSVNPGQGAWAASGVAGTRTFRIINALDMLIVGF